MDKFTPPANLINYTLIAAAVSFLAVILLSVFVLWPKFQELKIVQKEIEGKKTELQAKEGYVLKLGELKTKIEEYEQEISKIDSVIPDKPSLPSLFNYLQKTSSGSGLILTDVSPFAISPAKDLTGLRETVFSIKVSGPYSSFKSFLSTLEKSARLIEVGSISFSSPKEKGESFDFDLNIKANSY